MAEEPKHDKKHSFVQKVWITGGIFSLITVLLLLFKATFSVLILLLAGTLIAVFFRGISEFIKKKTGWKSGLTMTISVLGTILIISGIIWLIGAEIQSQLSQLSKSLPSTFENARRYLNDSWVGQEISEKISMQRTNGKMVDIFSRFFRTTFGLLGDLYVILLVGAYLSATPFLYTKGIKKLVPPRRRGKADEILSHLGHGLQQWLTGKIFAMFVVFILTAIGLKIIGVPMWLALAIIAGFLNFIPNFGPLIAMVPAVLVALSQDPQTALIVVALYLLVQFLESNLITPKVQQHLISIPPALIISAQLIVAIFTGIWGIILATPIMLVVIILVQDLYVKPMENKNHHSG
ncbi:AI-2E family transporter [Zunongwangia sp. F363]|uniref:AI-2E family transporter n=1 Tax=Autumnicola tepida TaxID=3075595 RepID=A0ABU3CAP6_9FLAO|nr:AI-2E family transporter [Zunongwangia sp. F363]MDT0643406.1 AI-2E family transporter [Zunongwangia sp. F363]